MIVKRLVLLSLIIQVCLTSTNECHVDEEEGGYSKPPYIGPSYDQLDEDIIPLISLSTALVLLPSPITYHKFAEFAHLTKSSVSIASNGAHAAFLVSLYHILIRLPSKYRTYTKLFDIITSEGMKFFSQYVFIRLIAFSDYILTSPIRDEAMGPHRDSYSTKLKPSLRKLARFALFALLLRDSLAEYRRGRSLPVALLGFVDFLSIVAEIKVAQSKKLTNYLPIVMTLRLYLVWLLQYI